MILCKCFRHFRCLNHLLTRSLHHYTISQSGSEETADIHRTVFTNYQKKTKKLHMYSEELVPRNGHNKRWFYLVFWFVCTMYESEIVKSKNKPYNTLTLLRYSVLLQLKLIQLSQFSCMTTWQNIKDIAAERGIITSHSSLPSIKQPPVIFKYYHCVPPIQENIK